MSLVTIHRQLGWGLPVIAALLISACGNKPAAAPAATALGTDSMAGMQGMQGMQGMAMPSAGDSGGVPIDRASAGRLGITFARAAVRPVRGSIRLVGTLNYAEPERAYLNARV